MVDAANSSVRSRKTQCCNQVTPLPPPLFSPLLCRCQLHVCVSIWSRAKWSSSHTHTEQRSQADRMKHALQLNSHKIQQYGTFLQGCLEVWVFICALENNVLFLWLCFVIVNAAPCPHSLSSSFSQSHWAEERGLSLNAVLTNSKLQILHSVPLIYLP